MDRILLLESKMEEAATKLDDILAKEGESRADFRRENSNLKATVEEMSRRLQEAESQRDSLEEENYQGSVRLIEMSEKLSSVEHQLRDKTQEAESLSIKRQRWRESGDTRPPPEPSAPSAAARVSSDDLRSRLGKPQLASHR